MAAIAKEFTPEELQVFCQEWRSYLTLLRGRVNERDLTLALEVVKPENFGHGQGKLRPNADLAKYDLCGIFVPMLECADDGLLLICRISPLEREAAKRNPYYFDEEPEPEDFGTRIRHLKHGLVALGYEA